MMHELVIKGNILKFYPYRTALLTNWVVKLTLDEFDVNYLRRKLAKSGYKLDNHIVFTTENGVFWYSDNHLYIGGTVKEGSY